MDIHIPGILVNLNHIRYINPRESPPSSSLGRLEYYKRYNRNNTLQVNYRARGSFTS
jgi:hypothetical protein